MIECLNFMDAIIAGEPSADVLLANVPYRDFIDEARRDAGVLTRRYFLARDGAEHVYLHHLLQSDDRRGFHDHPWPFTSILLTGDYIEHTPDGVFRRTRGSVLARPATWLHWLEIERPVWTLVHTGPLERVWGFQTPDGWIDYRRYTHDAREQWRARSTSGV